MNTGGEGLDEEITDILVDFMEVAIHALLHARRVYPQDIFERRRKYGVPVWMSRHPELNEYICQILFRVKTLMTQGVVRKIIVCMLEEGARRGRTVVEKVAFDVGLERNGDRHARNVVEGTSRRGQDGSLTSMLLQEVEDQLRSALLQIEKSSAHLPTRRGCTFELHVEAQEPDTTEGYEVQQDGDGATAIRSALRGGNWLLAENDSNTALAQQGRLHLVPIKSVRGSRIRLDLSSEMGDWPNN